MSLMSVDFFRLGRARRGDACALSTWKRLKKAHGGGDDADFQEARDPAVTSELQAEVDGGADWASVGATLPSPGPTKTGVPACVGGASRPAPCRRACFVGGDGEAPSRDARTQRRAASTGPGARTKL